MTNEQHFSAIGKHTVRLDGRAKADGSAKFTVDIRLAGMIYMKVLRSPHAHARVKEVYTQEAEKMPGVLGVLSHLDLAGLRVHNDMLDDRVSYLGEAVAAVAALREDTAAHAMGRSTLPEFVVTGNASIEVRENGTALVMAGITDIGQGQATGLAQIAAEAIGLKVEDIHVLWGDTIAPITGHQVASSTTMMTGNAVRLAGLDAKRQILKHAVPVLEAAEDELEIEDGHIYVKGNPVKRVLVSQIVRMPGVKTILGKGSWFLPEAKCSPRTVMVCIAEVAVDEETGKVEVTDMIQGTECGQIISPARVEGQMQAVLSGGIGYALMENWAMDESRGGMILNTNLLDYKIPTFADTGDILRKSIILENPDPEGPFGARGMGEASLSASAPAILNAVYNAVGVRFHEMPLTPARVLQELGNANM